MQDYKDLQDWDDAVHRWGDLHGCLWIGMDGVFWMTGVGGRVEVVRIRILRITRIYRIGTMLRIVGWILHGWIWIGVLFWIIDMGCSSGGF